MKRLLLFVCILALLITGCAAPTPAPTQAPVGLPNPASENCIAKGGQLNIVDAPQGQYGVCVFEDNLQCEEWAMYRGDCPVGGIKITGYITEAAKYCAITGGQYDVTANSGDPSEKGTCTFKNGKVCDAEAYYDGTCTAEN